MVIRDDEFFREKYLMQEQNLSRLKMLEDASRKKDF